MFILQYTYNGIKHFLHVRNLSLCFKYLCEKPYYTVSNMNFRSYCMLYVVQWEESFLHVASHALQHTRHTWYKKAVGDTPVTNNDVSSVILYIRARVDLSRRPIGSHGEHISLDVYALNHLIRITPRAYNMCRWKI